MSLQRYREKRDFHATPEPRGRVRAGTRRALAFVIQKHAASHLHYDFRLELNGVLLSWAVPKGPSLDPGARTRDWLKVKCGSRQEMVIGGYTDPQGGRTGFGALLLGIYESDRTFRYAGKVGTGFDANTLTSVRRMLDKLAQDAPPFANPPRGYEARGVHWVKPTLVAEVAFTEWTRDGTLRHPSFQGLRQDKKARDVMREHPAARTPSVNPTPAPPVRQSRRPVARPPTSNAAVVAGVTLSHPDKMFFPESNLSKRAVAEYYEKIGEWMIPHLRDRPLSLVRCPDGWRSQCFYQKHADRSVNPAVDRVLVPEGRGTATYMAASTTTAIVALLQWGVVEFHPWGSRKSSLDRPDRLIFDFDPADDVTWSNIASAANVMRTLLDDLGLAGFPKTTGGKGLHVIVPIRTTLDWPQAKAFTKAMADLLVSTFPERFTATLSKAKRKGKIFVDYLRNAEGATAIAPYSVRARANAPVSTPIAWDELKRDVRFAYFNVNNIPKRLGAGGDPWESFFQVRQSITKPMMKRVGLR